MQGWRISMEDSHAAILDLQNSDKPHEPKAVGDRFSFFGVYDGHGGDKVALFSGQNVHKILAKQAAFESGNFEQALKDGFLATDRAILQGSFGPLSVGWGRMADTTSIRYRFSLRGRGLWLHCLNRAANQ